MNETSDATCCAVCGGEFSAVRIHIHGRQYHERCAIMSYPSHTHEDYARLSAELSRLRAEVAEWRQAAKTEASLRREFLARADAAEQALAQAREALSPLVEFARWAISEGPWEGCDLDGGSVQERAVQLGLIIKTKYDPAIHGEGYGEWDEVEPGEDWYVFGPLLTPHKGDADG